MLTLIFAWIRAKYGNNNDDLVYIITAFLDICILIVIGIIFK